uniref:Uncharacterized protein n=1 Tax=Rhizophora mucronata TaxID=61149 RepID=A0A2P2LSL3_RHIMU
MTTSTSTSHDQQLLHMVTSIFNQHSGYMLPHKVES